MQVIRCDESRSEGFDTVILTRADLKNDLGAIKSWYTDSLKDNSSVLIISIYSSDLGLKPTVKKLDEALKPVLAQCRANGIKTIYTIEKDLSNRLSGNRNIGMREMFSNADCPNARFICGVNYKTIDRTPSNKDVLQQTVQDLDLAIDGKIIHNSSKSLVSRLGIELEYAYTVPEVEDFLGRMLVEESLGMDIETYSLQKNLAKIGSISMSANKQHSGAFSIEFQDTLAYTRQVRGMLKEFFDQYKGQKIFYNSCFDVGILTYELFMKHKKDWLGMREGIDALYHNCDDPLFMSFCLRNSVLKPDLKLKSLLYPYFGNYGIDVTDITLHTKEELLYYGNLDSCGMHWIFDDLWEELVKDEESLSYYQNQLLENRMVITEAEIVGLPIDLKKVKELETKLIKESKIEEENIRSLQEVKVTENILAGERYGKNFSNKRVVKKISDYKEPLNFNSPNQLNKLLYEVMNLPVVLETEKGNSSSSNDALNMLKNMFEGDEKVIGVLDSLLTYFKYNKLLSSFIPAFYKYADDKEGHNYVCGGLNLIGTVSGRLSSSHP